MITKDKFFKETESFRRVISDSTIKDKLDAKLYQSALFDTINELNQAVEGMYHNLNTLGVEAVINYHLLLLTMYMYTSRR